jgi:hypothetical protein
MNTPNYKLQKPEDKWILILVPEIRRPIYPSANAEMISGERAWIRYEQELKYYEEALSKAPQWEVKNQEETNILIYPGHTFDSSIMKNWQPDPTKLYDLPKGYKTELLCFQTGTPCGFPCNGDCINNQVAILIPEENMNKYKFPTDFSNVKVFEEVKETESQDELWDYAFTEVPVRIHPKTEEWLKSKFTITRNK